MWPIVTDGVAWSVCLSVCLSVGLLQSWVLQKIAELIEILFGMWTRVGRRNPRRRSPVRRGNFEGKSGCTLWSVWTHCHELCTNVWTDQDAVWYVDLGGSKEACIRWRVTLAPPDEYDWTIHVRQWCCLFVKLLWPLVVSIIQLSLSKCWKEYKAITYPASFLYQRMRLLMEGTLFHLCQLSIRLWYSRVCDEKGR